MKVQYTLQSLTDIRDWHLYLAWPVLNTKKIDCEYERGRNHKIWKSLMELAYGELDESLTVKKPH